MRQAAGAFLAVALSFPIAAPASAAEKTTFQVDEEFDHETHLVTCDIFPFLTSLDFTPGDTIEVVGGGNNGIVTAEIRTEDCSGLGTVLQQFQVGPGESNFFVLTTGARQVRMITPQCTPWCVTLNPVSPTCSVNCPAADADGVRSGPNRSPDFDGNGSVVLVDLSIFAAAFPPNSYDMCADFDCDGIIGLVDLAIFAIHFLHTGAQNGVCN